MNKIQNSLLIFAMFFSASVLAQVTQNFEEILAQPLTGSCLYSDSDASSIHVVQNIVDNDCPGLITVLSPSSGTILGFQNILDPINDTQPSGDGFSEGDAFGVANNTSMMAQLGASAPEGTQGFIMEDIDANISMEFDNVDLTGTTNPMVSLQYFVSTTTYEAPDFLTITVEIAGCGAATTVTLLDADTPAELDAVEGSWNTVSANLSAYVGCTAVLKIGYSSDSSGEELGIDNIIFTEGIIEIALPAELLYIKGESLVERNRITWASAVEINVQHYLIERSINGYDNWTEIDRMDAAGFSSETIHYEWFDNAPVTSSYYRLKNVDFDGTSETSEVVFLERERTDFGLLNVYPNPTHNEISINFDHMNEGTVVLVLTDHTGRIVVSKNAATKVGTNKISLDLSSIEAGMYLLQIETGKERLHRQIIKQ